MLLFTSTGGLVVGFVLLAIILVLLFFLGRLAIRLVMWPFRARRPKAAGLGSEYEQMVQQASKVVLPTPRRTRAPELEPGREWERHLPFPPRPAPAPTVAEPAARTVPASVAAVVAATAPTSPVAVAAPLAGRKVRWWRRKVVVPPWVLLPLAWLGAVYLISPVSRDWYLYGSAVAIAVVIGVRRARRYRVTVLHRGERDVVVWMRWRKKADAPETPPTVTFPSSE